MAVRNDFAAGEVLAAADLNDTFASKVDYATPANAQSGTTYTFVLADATRMTTATSSSAKTFTIPPQSSVTWAANSIIRVVNYGAGALTVNGGSGVTVTNTASTLAQYQAAAVIRTGSDAWTLVPFAGGAGNANFSNAATGTYTDGGVSYKYLTFTASGTLTVTKAGFADVLVIGGGGGGGSWGGGGAGGHLYSVSTYLPVGSHSVTVGAGGSAGATLGIGTNGSSSRLLDLYGVGGGGGGIYDPATVKLAASGLLGIAGGSGGGGGGNANNIGGAAGAGISGQGSSGGTTAVNTGGPGGGGGSAVGGNASSNTGGNGGAGTANSITGTSVTRAGGGGGGGGTTAGTGGSGGGGTGTLSGGAAATAGTANTGGGGGGGYGSAGNTGGSGVVIIRVEV